MFGRVSDFLYNLNARGACADLGNALALQIDLVLWPYRCVVYITSEVPETGEWRSISGSL
jgi:hypothetical protein